MDPTTENDDTWLDQTESFFSGGMFGSEADLAAQQQQQFAKLSSTDVGKAASDAVAASVQSITDALPSESTVIGGAVFVVVALVLVFLILGKVDSL